MSDKAVLTSLFQPIAGSTRALHSSPRSVASMASPMLPLIACREPKEIEFKQYAS